MTGRISPLTVVPQHVVVRPAPITAMRFDGTDAGAQAVALWAKESGDITSRSSMHFYAGSQTGRPEFLFDIIGDGGQVVDPGDWVVRMAGGMYLVLAQDAFDAIFQSVAGPAPITLSIQESR